MSNFRTDSDGPVVIDGASYQGTIRTTYDTLEKVFGEPRGGDGEKVTREWRIEFHDGTVATIYDWMQKRTPYNEYDWHIGGHDENAVTAVYQAIEDVIKENNDDFFG